MTFVSTTIVVYDNMIQFSYVHIPSSEEEDSGVSSWPLFSSEVRARFGFEAIGMMSAGMKDGELTNEKFLVLKLFLSEGALDVFCTWTLVFIPVSWS